MAAVRYGRQSTADVPFDAERHKRHVRELHAPAAETLDTVPALYVRPAEWPRRFPGVAANDEELMRRHIAAGTFDGAELHFGVPVTRADPPAWVRASPRLAAIQESLWPHRIDVVARWPTSIAIVELKPGASYLALGQLLFYQFHGPRLYRELAGAELWCATDRAEPTAVPVFAAHGIRVIEVPGEPIPIGNVKT